MNEVPLKIFELKRSANSKSFFEYFAFLFLFGEARISAFGRY